MKPFIRTVTFAALVVAALTLGACGRTQRLMIPDEEIGRSWFPAPGGRYGVQIVEDPRRSVQEVWYRHTRKPDFDTLVDELHGPASLAWSPDSEFVVINHRDYAHLHDFIVLRVHRKRVIECGGLMDSVQELWQRLHPEPMESQAFLGVRWVEGDDNMQLLVAALAEPEGQPGELVRQALLVDPITGVVRLTDNPPELMAMTSPFRR